MPELADFLNREAQECFTPGPEKILSENYCLEAGLDNEECAWLLPNREGLGKFVWLAKTAGILKNFQRPGLSSRSYKMTIQGPDLDWNFEFYKDNSTPYVQVMRKEAKQPQGTFLNVSMGEAGQELRPLGSAPTNILSFSYIYGRISELAEDKRTASQEK